MSLNYFDQGMSHIAYELGLYLDGTLELTRRNWSDTCEVIRLRMNDVSMVLRGEHLASEEFGDIQINLNSLLQSPFEMLTIQMIEELSGEVTASAKALLNR